MQPSQMSMDEVTRGLATVSDKIRALNRAGYARADIARYLGKRYQHVRNVLEQDKARQQTVQQPALPSRAAKCRLGEGGRIVIPAQFRESLHLREGDTLFLRTEDGELRLAPIRSVTERVRSLLRKYVPAGTPMVEDLLAERRSEAARELQDE